MTRVGQAAPAGEVAPGELGAGGGDQVTVGEQVLARVRRLREWEKTTGEVWHQMRDEAERWRRFPRRHRAARESAAAAQAPPIPAGTPPDVIA